MRSAALTALVALVLALVAPVSAAPAVADLDVAVPAEELVVADDETVTVDLQVHAELRCTVGWAPPEPVRGALRGFVRDDGEVHEFARAPLGAAWQDRGDGSYALDERLTLEIPTSDPAFAPGANDVVVQFLPDQAREPQRSCDADGYRVDPAEETFTVRVVGQDEAQAFSAVQAIQDEDRFHALPMLLALTLVGLLAVFAFRRQRR